MRKKREPRTRRAQPAQDSTAADLDPLLIGTLEMLDRERGLRAWLRSRATRARVAFGVIGLLTLAVAQLLLARRPDLSVYPPWRMGLACGLMAGGTRALLRLHLRSISAPPLRPVVPRATTAIFAAILVLFAAAPQAHAEHLASLAGAGTDFAARAAACFAYGLVVSAPFALLCWFLRRDDRTTASAELVPAVASSLVANLLLQLHCPITSPQHLLAGHASITLGWVLIYARFARVAARLE